MQARRDELRAMTPEGTPLSTPRSSARKAPGVSDLLRAGAAPAPLWADGDAPARASAEVKSQRSLLNALLDDSLRGAAAAPAAPAAGGRESVEVGADFSFVSSSVEVKKFGRKKPAPGDAEASPPPPGAARVGAWGVEGAEGAEGARHAASLVVGDLQLEDVDAGDAAEAEAEAEAEADEEADERASPRWAEPRERQEGDYAVIRSEGVWRSGGVPPPGDGASPGGRGGASAEMESDEDEEGAAGSPAAPPEEDPEPEDEFARALRESVSEAVVDARASLRASRSVSYALQLEIRAALAQNVKSLVQHKGAGGAAPGAAPGAGGCANENNNANVPGAPHLAPPDAPLAGAAGDASALGGGELTPRGQVSPPPFPSY
jgi:hypothetical protein